ncbi:hypothetical protein [Bacillus cereus]|uniref:hypothetical protein n=1 Tax=Bacillus cereus TaxID=1396 RepID=UPI001E39B4B4|nr:hypothetical protein [Bacillus cereus]
MKCPQKVRHIISFISGLVNISDETNPFMNEFLLESQDLNGVGIIDFSTSVRPKGWGEYPYAEIPLFEQYVQYL